MKKTPSLRERRSALVACLFTVLALVLLCLAWSFPPEKPKTPQTADVPPPTRIEWDTFPVGGYWLVHPFRTDSTGRNLSLQIPPGAILRVPRVIHGEAEPDSLRRAG